MNYSKSMKVKFKRLFIFWFITLLIAGLIGSGITTLLMKPKDVEALETCEKEVYFFTHEVQEQEPELTDIIEPIPEEPLLESLGEYRITAYCPCEICCGNWAKNRPTDENGNLLVYTASGELAVEGVTIAADTSILPFGTEVIIDGNKYIVQDRGRVIKNNRIDVYFENHQDALEFGVQYKEVFIKRMVEND